MKKIALLFCALLTPSLTILSQAGEFGVNVYGLSYHVNRTSSDGRSFNELNPGIGVKYLFLRVGQSSVFCEAGVFSDSEKNTARYAAVGYGFDLMDSLLSFGLSVGPYKSATLNNNETLLAVIPMVSTRLSWISFQLVYLPAYKDVNRVHTLGFFATVYPLEF